MLHLEQPHGAKLQKAQHGDNRQMLITGADHLHPKAMA
jgi:hypothetical protein